MCFHRPYINDAGLQTDWEGRLLNMCVIVFFPPRFRGVKGNAGLRWGVPGRGDWSVTHSCHTEPRRTPNPRPGLFPGRGAGPGLGAAGVPQAFSSNSSHQHKGDQVPAGSLLRKDWAKTWQNGLTEAYTHTYTHTISNAFWGLSVLPVGMVGKKWSREEKKKTPKINQTSS